MNYSFEQLENNLYRTTFEEAKLEFTLLANKVYVEHKHIGTWDYKNNQIIWIGNILTPLVKDRADGWEWFYQLNYSLSKIIPDASDMACLKNFTYLN